MKKIILLVMAIIFGTNLVVAATDDFLGVIKYEVDNIIVNSPDGQYIEDVFSKYDSEIYEDEWEQFLVGDFDYSLSWGQIKTRLGLLDSNSGSLELNNYLLGLRWKDTVGFKAGSGLRPKLPEYIFSNNHLSNYNNQETTAGVIAQLSKDNLEVNSFYLKVDKDLEGFVTDVEAYGLDSSLIAKKNLTIGATALQVKPEDKVANDIKEQKNYSFRLDYQPQEWLTIDTDLARSIKDDENYTEEVYSNLARINLKTEFNANLNTELSYQQVHELYAPLRTTEYKEEYAFRETDYKQGYQITADYRLPPELKSRLELKYSNYSKTNSYIQSAPYIQGLGIADKLLDDEMKTYQLGVISETGRFYSRLFYTHELTTNDTNPNIMVDPTEMATENEDLTNNYSPGYKDKTINTIHLYNKYKLVVQKDYNLSLNGRYVYQQEDNKYHNHSRNLSNQITENIAIIGLDSNYRLTSRLLLTTSYSVEERDIDFKVEDNNPAFAKGRLQNLDLGLDYQITDRSNFKFTYQYQNYNLLDHNLSTEGEIYRYYDHDFNTQQTTIGVETKF